jgi:hypothetical protein
MRDKTTIDTKLKTNESNDSSKLTCEAPRIANSGDLSQEKMKEASHSNNMKLKTKIDQLCQKDKEYDDDIIFEHSSELHIGGKSSDDEFLSVGNLSDTRQEPEKVSKPLNLLSKRNTEN